MTTSRHELTPGMRAVLGGKARADRQAALALPLLLGGIPVFAALCAQRSPLEIALFGLLGGGGVGIVTYQRWRTNEERGAAALAAGTYARYTGPFALREVRRSTYTTAWQILVEGVEVALDEPAEYDQAWRTAGEAHGTLVYSPETGVLFAAWDRAGWRVYRDAAYDLAHDPAVQPPAAAGDASPRCPPHFDNDNDGIGCAS